MLDDKKNGINDFGDNNISDPNFIKEDREVYSNYTDGFSERDNKDYSNSSQSSNTYGTSRNFYEDSGNSFFSDQYNRSINGSNGNAGGSRPNKPNKTTSVIAICIIGSIIFGFVGGLTASKISSKNSHITIGYQTAVPKESSSQTVEYTGETMTTQEVASYASESVVEISTEIVQRGTLMQQYVVEGAGSGVIISEDGYLLTNNHVIEGANKITVRTKDTTSYEAKLIGTDSQLDVALLKIEATNLKPVVIGDSSSLQVGQKAIAIGNPLGELGGTVTEGIISALDRTIALNGNNMTLLQTDAAINPGNSGGGLFNSQGEFIGLVVAKSSGDDVEGLGFAIPVDNVKPIIEDLLNYGYVKGRPQLGVSLADISSMQDAKRYGVSQTGVYVASVSQGSSAASAGMKEGDLIVSIDGTTVGTSSEVQQIIKSHSVGDSINIQISRNSQVQNITVTLNESTPSTSQNSTSSQSLQSESQNNQYNQYNNPFFDFFGF